MSIREEDARVERFMARVAEEAHGGRHVCGITRLVSAEDGQEGYDVEAGVVTSRSTVT